MATIDKYKIVLDVQGQQAVERLSAGVAGLGTAIASIGFGAFIQGALSMADALSDVAKAAGLTTGEVYGLSRAIEVAGGDFEDAGKLVNTFYNNLESAASGTEKTQDALAKVGISLNDLKNLSESELLAKAVQELGRMEAGAARTALGMEIFGKAFRSIDPKALDEALKTQDVAAFTKALDAGADAIGMMENNFRALQLAALNILTPFIGEIKDMQLSAEQAEKVVKILGGALLAAFSVTVISTVLDLVKAIRALGIAIKGTAAAQAALLALSGPKGWALLAAGAAAATGAVIALNKALEDNADAQEKVKDAGGGRGFINPPMARPDGQGAFPQAQLLSNQELQARQQAVTAAKALTDQMRLQNAEALKLRDITIGTLGLETDYANFIKTNAQIRSDGTKQVSDLEAKITAERGKGRGTNQEVIAQYQEQIKLVQGQTQALLDRNQKEYDRLQLLKELKLETQGAIVLNDALFDAAMMAKRLNLIKLNGDALKVEQGILQEQIRSTVQLRNIRQQFKGLIDPTDLDKQEKMVDAANDYMRIVEETSRLQGQGLITQEEAQQRIIDGGQAISALVDQSKKAEMNLIFKALAAEQIKHNAIMQFIKAEAQAQREKANVQELSAIGAADQANIENMQKRLQLIGVFGDQLSNMQNKLQIEEEMNNRLLDIQRRRMQLGADATQAELDHLNQLEEAARNYAQRRMQLEEQRIQKEKQLQQDSRAGIESVMVQMEKMTTPFAKAQASTTALFNNMNSAIDNFVTTGKFSFRDFARSVIQDLIKIELKAQATALLRSILNTGGTILSSLFGFAEGGSPPLNKPSIVGEKGPELFIPRQPGTIVPNNQLGMAAAGIGMGAIQAPVTNNYITNNISALDAKSVAQLFAENRKTLLGTVEMARKEMPYYNR